MRHFRINLALLLLVVAAQLVLAALPRQHAAAASKVGSMPGMNMTGSMAATPPRPTLALHKKVVRVLITNFTFKPAALEVSPGTRIIWTNKDSDPHTVTSTKNLWHSDALDTDNQYTRTFKTAGSFSYYCAIHPFMHGLVIVKK